MKDLTRGSIVSHILNMAPPIVAGMVTIMICQLVDLYFVAGLGEAAIAGVGKLLKDDALAFDMAAMFVPIILLGLLSIFLNRGVRELEVRTVMPWLRGRGAPAPQPLPAAEGA